MIQGTDPDMGEVPRDLTSIVKEQPGIHFRELKRAADLSSNGQLRHHIDRLKRDGVLVEIKDGGFKRFFIAGEHAPEVRRGLARFARRVPRLIAKLLLTQSLNRTQLRQRLDCADSTLGYHLNRMIELGDLERDRRGNMCLYSLRDPDFVQSVLRDLGEDVPGDPQEPEQDSPAAEMAQRFLETFGPGWSLHPQRVAVDGHKRVEEPTAVGRPLRETSTQPSPAAGDGPRTRSVAPGDDLEVVEWPQPG